MNDTAQAPSQQVARRPTNFEIELANYEPQFAAALPSHISLDRFKRVIVTAINQNPDLMKADRRSLFLACVRAAQDGLFPDGREAALVMFKNIVQYLPMVAGIIKRMRNSGDVAAVDTQIVHEHDEFDYRLGDDPHINHKPTLGDPGKPIAAYAIIKLTNGEVLREVMSVAEIEKVRKVSRAANNGPWVSWWDQMARKSVLRRCSKRAPVSSDLDAMLQRDDENMLGRDRGTETTIAIPPRPTRAEVHQPTAPTGPTAGVTDVDDQSQEQASVEWEIALVDGELRTTEDPEAATTMLLEAIGEAAARGEQHLEGLWEAQQNVAFLTGLREANLGDLADGLNRAYGAALDEMQKRKRAATAAVEEEKKRAAAAAAAKPKPIESRPESAAEGQGEASQQPAAAKPAAETSAPAATPAPQRRQAAATAMRSPLSTRRETDWPVWVQWVIRQIKTAPSETTARGLADLYRAEFDFCRENRASDYDQIVGALDEKRAPAG